MRLVDVKCKSCGREHEVLVRTGEDPKPEEGCECGNKDEFETLATFAKAPTHSSWSVR